MNFITDADIVRIGIVIAIFGVMCFLTYLSFRLSDVIVEKVGKNVIGVFEKVMGLIIAIIGTNMIIEGVKIAFELP